LEASTRDRFPMALEVAFRWSGQVMEPVDGLAFIGRNPMDAPNIYMATGNSGNDMTHSTIAGMLLTDLIMGRDNSWAALYQHLAARRGKKRAIVAVAYAIIVSAFHRLYRHEPHSDGRSIGSSVFSWWG
jgi:glycine/D-amino acid oxidase-like deaminating enzyme